MKSLENYYVYDLINQLETCIDVNSEELRAVWPAGYFDYTDTIYNRKALRINPTELEKHGSVEAVAKIMYGDEVPEFRAYIEAGTQLLPYKDCFRGQNVLDIGCGNGDLAFVMEQLGANVTACDVHEENIAVCNQIKAHFDSNIEFAVKDVNDLSIDYLRGFDTVCAFQCLSWTNCHVEFFKNTNKAGVKHLLITEQLKGLPHVDCVNDRSYGSKEPMLLHFFDQGYHYGGTGWKQNKKCLRVETNLPFWVQVLDYYGWYIQDWSWQKNCRLNNKIPEVDTYNRRFLFHCINTNQGETDA